MRKYTFSLSLSEKKKTCNLSGPFLSLNLLQTLTNKTCYAQCYQPLQQYAMFKCAFRLQAVCDMLSNTFFFLSFTLKLLLFIKNPIMGTSLLISHLNHNISFNFHSRTQMIFKTVPLTCPQSFTDTTTTLYLMRPVYIFNASMSNIKYL